mmetsp:Transcript_4543/g.13260  ORF Transcript_4543/g.13260 Transcript_4543/m.13260 type:complete len:82 (-) Transcript_4543:342-587(-)
MSDEQISGVNRPARFRGGPGQGSSASQALVAPEAAQPLAAKLSALPADRGESAESLASKVGGVLFPSVCAFWQSPSKEDVE